MPLGGTSADWSNWSQKLSSDFHSTSWASEVTGDGCSLINATASDITSNGSPAYGGVPAGVVIPAETLVMQCGNGAVPAFQANIPSARAVASAQAPATAASTAFSPQGGCAGISGPGSLCVNTGTWTGSSTGWGIFTSYLYNGSGTLSGHVELSISNGACAPGASAYANSATSTLSSGQEMAVVVPWTVDANWVGTLWKISGSSLVNYGNHCETF